MSENVSSSVLFHFTNSLDSIVNILSSGFYPHYCPEYSFGALDSKASSMGEPPGRAAPMVCFCDLPLSLIRKHMAEYGQFGIGLDKVWGIQNGVTPVFYMHEFSKLFLTLSSQVWRAKGEADAITTNELQLLVAHMKPYIGHAWRGGSTKLYVRFYDEREWRFVPHLGVEEQLFLSRDDYSKPTKVVSLHEHFKQKYKLTVTPNDIQYLIVPDDSHILKLVERLRALYEPDDTTFVTTSIMTVDRIAEDI